MAQARTRPGTAARPPETHSHQDEPNSSATPAVGQALALARAGLPVFPCRPDNKKPLVDGGFKAATCDPEQVLRWWRYWPWALPAIPTGAPSGLFVVDLDTDRKTGETLGEDSFAKLGLPWPPYAVHTPLHNGWHLYYRWREGLLGNTAGRLPGVDTRSGGGFIIAWDVDTLRNALRDPAITEPPAELLAALTRPPPEVNGGAYTYRPGGASGWAEKALVEEAGDVAGAAEGSRNDRLNVAAFRLGQIVAGGHLDPGRVEADLAAAAAAAGLPPGEAAATIKSGMTAGSATPRGPKTAEESGDHRRKHTARPDPADTNEGPAMDARTGTAGDQTDDHAGAEPAEGVSIDDFWAYMPSHSYIFTPSREFWPASSVNARVRGAMRGDQYIPASALLDQSRPVEQMTWSPGEPMVIEGRLVAAGGWIERPGCTVFNLYKPPSIRARPGDAGLWVDHVGKLFGEDAPHIINWLAHRVQCPAEKVNHCLVIGGRQGVGKDTLLEPVKHAVGPWNFAEVSPVQLLGRFNGFLKSVILRVSEARDLGEVNRYGFYDHIKSFAAAPPDVLRIDEKNIREYSVFNVCGLILTTNHKTDGLYLPADDRRHFVAWSDATLEDFDADYWTGLYGWYADGGNEIVTAYLSERDLTTFNPKAPPPKTDAFWEIVGASHAPENAELLTLLNKLGWPDALTIDSLRKRADASLTEWLDDRRNRKAIPRRLEDCDYVRVHNRDSKQGLWLVQAKQQVVYAKSALSLRGRIAAAAALR